MKWEVQLQKKPQGHLGGSFSLLRLMIYNGTGHWMALFSCVGIVSSEGFFKNVKCVFS